MAHAHIDPLVTNPSRVLHRIGRATDPLQFSVMDAADALLHNAGNRFDVPGGGVLYCATELATCFYETLARFRPTSKIREFVAAQDGVDKDFMVVGGVPADWRYRRLKVSVAVEGGLPFLDVEAPETLEHLNACMSTELADLGVDNLDAATVMGPDRRVTRAISSWAYSAQDENGDLLYGGVRYLSRLVTKECWAIFDGSPVREVSRNTIDPSDPALRSVAHRFGLTPH